MKYSTSTTDKIKKLCEFIQGQIELKGKFKVQFDDTHAGIANDTKNVIELLRKNECLFRTVEKRTIVYPENFNEEHDFFTLEIDPIKFNNYIRNELRILPPSIESIGEIKKIEYLENFRSFSLNDRKSEIQLKGGKKIADILELLWKNRRVSRKGRVDPLRIGEFYNIEPLMQNSRTVSTEALLRSIGRINTFFVENYLPMRIESKNQEKFRLEINF